MGERKVLNKYYPPDFDPAKIPRRKQPKNLQMKVRMMLPMSIRCATCGNYIYKGTKFNCRKEDVLGETYLGILIFRFYFKCTRCSAELIMKTDPQNSDYIMESGATRNFEPWRAKDEAQDEAKKQRESDEMGDAMKALENRAIDSKQEMDIMAALDEMKSMRSRQATIDTSTMLEALRRTAPQPSAELPEEDEALIKSLFERNSSGIVRRIGDDDDEDDAPRGNSLGQVSGLEKSDVMDEQIRQPSAGFTSEESRSKRLKVDGEGSVQRPSGDIAKGENGNGGAGPAASDEGKQKKPLHSILQVKVVPKPAKAAVSAKPKSSRNASKIGVARLAVNNLQKQPEQPNQNVESIGNGAIVKSTPGLASLSCAYGSDDE